MNNETKVNHAIIARENDDCPSKIAVKERRLLVVEASLKTLDYMKFSLLFTVVFFFLKFFFSTGLRFYRKLLQIL